MEDLYETNENLPNWLNVVWHWVSIMVVGTMLALLLLGAASSALTVHQSGKYQATAPAQTTLSAQQLQPTETAQQLQPTATQNQLQ
jgi:hypothetical protein